MAAVTTRKRPGRTRTVAARPGIRVTQKSPPDHLSRVGIKAATRTRYRRMVLLFFDHLTLYAIRTPRNLSDLDYEASEFVNHLWQEGEPIGWAGNFLSGLQRFFPAAKRHLPTAWQYHSNWASTILPNRAVPFTSLQIRGLAGLCIRISRPDFAVILLVGFICLLRTGEMVCLAWEQITLLENSLVVVALFNTKTNKRKRGSESVIFDDPVIRKLIVSTRRGRYTGPVLTTPPASFRQCFALLLDFFGMSAMGYLPYSVRRGGATWHFQTYGSMSKTCLHGRWSAEKTARLYIEDAMAAVGQSNMSRSQRRQLAELAQLVA